MTTIREIIDSLKKEDRRLLDYAFENGIAQIVRLPEHRFVGVNTSTIPNLIIEQEAGLWTAGMIRE